MKRWKMTPGELEVWKRSTPNEALRNAARKYNAAIASGKVVSESDNAELVDVLREGLKVQTEDGKAVAGETVVDIATELALDYLVGLREPGHERPFNSGLPPIYATEAEIEEHLLTADFSENSAYGGRVSAKMFPRVPDMTTYEDETGEREAKP